jgi:hypothetical protein
MAAAESFSSAAFAPWWVVGLDFQLPDYQITQLLHCTHVVRHEIKGVKAVQ